MAPRLGEEEETRTPKTVRPVGGGPRPCGRTRGTLPIDRDRAFGRRRRLRYRNGIGLVRSTHHPGPSSALVEQVDVALEHPRAVGARGRQRRSPRQKPACDRGAHGVGIRARHGRGPRLALLEAEHRLRRRLCTRRRRRRGPSPVARSTVCNTPWTARADRGAVAALHPRRQLEVAGFPLSRAGSSTTIPRPAPSSSSTSRVSWAGPPSARRPRSAAEPLSSRH